MGGRARYGDFSSVEEHGMPVVEEHVGAHQSKSTSLTYVRRLCAWRYGVVVLWCCRYFSRFSRVFQVQAFVILTDMIVCVLVSFVVLV